MKVMKVLLIFCRVKLISFSSTRIFCRKVSKSWKTDYVCTNLVLSYTDNSALLPISKDCFSSFVQSFFSHYVDVIKCICFYFHNYK